MNISLMRFIDKFFGIPLCFMFSLINSFFKCFTSDKSDTAYKNILIIELPEMGSALLSYSAVKYLKNNLPDANIYFLTFQKNRESVEILNILPENNIITIASNNILNFLKDTLSTILFFRKKNIDLIIDLEMFSRFSVIYSFLIYPRDIAGFHLYNVEGLYRGNFLTKKVTFNYYQHISKNYLALIKAVFAAHNTLPLLKENINDEITLPRNAKNDKLLENIKNKICSHYNDFSQNNKIILLNPDGGEIPVRGWSYANYYELALLILNQLNNILIIITGSENSIKKNCELHNKINHPRCIDFTGKTSLYELIQLMHISEILITNDGGAAHFSALTSIKSFVFYGPETPVLYKPLSQNSTILYKNYNCSPCLNIFNYRISACKNNKCVNDYSPDEVFQLLKCYQN